MGKVPDILCSELKSHWFASVRSVQTAFLYPLRSKVLLVPQQLFVGLIRQESKRQEKQQPSAGSDLSSASKTMGVSNRRGTRLPGVTNAQKGLVAGSGAARVTSASAALMKRCHLPAPGLGAVAALGGTVQLVAGVPMEQLEGRGSSLQELLLQAAAAAVVRGRLVSPRAHLGRRQFTPAERWLAAPVG